MNLKKGIDEYLKANAAEHSKVASIKGGE